MSFLKAEWRKLAIANYELDPSILEKHLPYGTELDLWKGKCYVSVVGFMFINTRLLGIPIPFHRNFEEVNLRFYVRRKEGNEWRRGVVFVKELVPKRAITFVANTVYKENYETVEMDHSWIENDASRTVQYCWKRNNIWEEIKIVVELNPVEIGEGSEEEFITEHYWGYAHVSDSRSNAYEVRHPRWMTYTVIESKISIDFGANYGSEFSFLTNQDPSSVMLAEGSLISVEGKQKIKKT
ncbi:MAG: hypothetical protein ACI837_002004 [Crocinitomicaceae bacterium]|jgi:uncharacterized protein YqjF (DUF2071 family)